MTTKYSADSAKAILPRLTTCVFSKADNLGCFYDPPGISSIVKLDKNWYYNWIQRSHADPGSTGSCRCAQTSDSEPLTVEDSCCHSATFDYVKDRLQVLTCGPRRVNDDGEDLYGVPENQQNEKIPL